MIEEKLLWGANFLGGIKVTFTPTDDFVFTQCHGGQVTLLDVVVETSGLGEVDKQFEISVVDLVNFRAMWVAHHGEHFGASHAQFQLSHVFPVLRGEMGEAWSVGKGQIKHAADNEASGLGEGQGEKDTELKIFFHEHFLSQTVPSATSKVKRHWTGGVGGGSMAVNQVGER